MGTGADWEPVARTLAARFHCLAVDWPGHGQTPLSTAQGIGYAQWNAVLNDTLTAHGLPAVTLIGYSMGGRLALDFALRYPHRVQTLALISANPGIGDPAQRAARRCWDADNARRLREDGLPAFLQYWYNLPLFASLDAVPGRKPAVIARRSGQDAKTLAQIITTISPGTQPSLWPHLSALKIPVLAVYGQLDEKYQNLTREMSRRHPHIRTVGVPQAGHAVHVEQPEALTKIIANFLGDASHE